MVLDYKESKGCDVFCFFCLSRRLWRKLIVKFCLSITLSSLLTLTCSSFNVLTIQNFLDFKLKLRTVKMRYFPSLLFSREKLTFLLVQTEIYRTLKFLTKEIIKSRQINDRNVVLQIRVLLSCHQQTSQ